MQEKERFNEGQQKIKEDLERQQYQEYLKRKVKKNKNITKWQLPNFERKWKKPLETQ